MDINILWQKNDKIALGLSGGVDSIALFLLPDDSPAYLSHCYISKRGEKDQTNVYLVPKEDFISFYASKLN